MTCICMKRMGGWNAFLESLSEGLTSKQFSEKIKISEYAAKVLLESSLAIGALKLKENEEKELAKKSFYLTKLGHVLARDKMTQVNFDFMYDVCFKGLFYLEDSLRQGKPVGLKELGPWETIYEGLRSLPEPAKESWFSFDHFYSDSAFEIALPKIFARKVSKVLDIGGNTGRFAQTLLKFNEQVSLTIADLPSQIHLAKIASSNFAGKDRLNFFECNLLDKASSLPTGFDVVWMSQFLVCFSEAEIESIFNKIKQSLNPSGRVFVLDTFWDRQQSEAVSFCIIQTSPYFTAMANGNSKMYDFQTIASIAQKSGFKLKASWDGLGLSHTLIEFELN